MNKSYSFGILDQISQDSSISDLITENILAISPSKRIFILSNENRSFSKGDFISIVHNATLTARALVAKNTDGGSGIKIVKIYNWQKWQQLAKGIPVQIIRGDDSYFKPNKENKSDEELNIAKIEGEEDLFNKTEILGENLSEDEKQTKIRQDHFLSINYGLYTVIGNGENLSLNLFSIDYNYQIGTDFWLGVNVGSGTLNAFPAANLNTNVTTITVTGSYIFNLPFYSYVAPYAGFNYQMAVSPKAGTDDGTNTQEDRDLELAQVQAINSGSIVFGAKLIRHLAPGWYAVLGIGTDMIRGGVAIEF